MPVHKILREVAHVDGYRPHTVCGLVLPKIKLQAGYALPSRTDGKIYPVPLGSIQADKLGVATAEVTWAAHLVTCEACRALQYVTHHLCHANGCNVRCRPENLFCARHWNMVPKELQREVWKHYRPGQCDDKKPSPEWHKAADAAIAWVQAVEAGI